MTIHGTVTKAEDGQPAANSVVQAQGETSSDTQTDVDGMYSLSVATEPGGYVSVTAVSSDGEMSDSVILAAIEGSKEADFSLVSALCFDSVADVAARELDNIVIQLFLSGEAGSVVTLSSRGLPSGAVLDEENLRIEWQTMIGDSGIYYVTIFANSDDGRNTFVEFRITIKTEGVYTLAYHAGQNGSISGMIYQVAEHGADGSSVTAVPDTGYHFVQWSDGSTSNPRTDTNVTADINVTANFSANEYTVTFDTQGGTPTDPVQKQVTYDAAYGTLPITSRTNYIFNGWFTEPSGGEEVTEATIVSTASDHTLYAQWTANEYIVTFQTDGTHGATLEGTLEQTILHGEDCTAVTAHAPAGLDFIRWSKDSQLFSLDNPLTVTNVTENMTLTAEFDSSLSIRSWEIYK